MAMHQQQPKAFNVSFSLQVRSSDRVIEERDLPAGTSIWLGRDPVCDLVLSDLSVSRRHARIEARADGIDLVDESVNGTVVNGEVLRGSRKRLATPASVQIGPFDIVLQSGDDARGAEVVPLVPRAERAAAADAAIVTPRPAAGALITPPDPALALGPEVEVRLRRAIHRQLIEHLDLASLERSKMDSKVMRPKVTKALKSIVADFANRLPRGTNAERLVAELCDEALGLGPLEALLSDESVSEIMVVDPRTIFFERNGKLERSQIKFTDDESVRAVIERIVTPLGRRIDESTPLVDARLPDGSRVNAVIPPLAVRGAAITIRKFTKKKLGLTDLMEFSALTSRMGRFLERSVKVRRNVLISGGTGSGKTTLLNVLSAAIPEAERIVTIEDAAELRLDQTHVVSLESRPANMEGKGAYTIRDLVRNALRMRPDRIVVGECRGGEALDMLQAMNTGHEGSMTTIHANSPREAISRLETLCLMAGLDLPVRAIRQQIASSVHLVVQQTRFSDGARKVTSIAEVGEVGPDGEITMHEIFTFARTGTGKDGRVNGEFRATGFMPTYLDELITHGLITDGEYL
jgi:pilus assembly protein CpaF